ncbi:glycoside hydrolase family 79 protein [Trametopsis cervina]|nr:glycoside hydrolase family 79 protein [Trametopsis cervina]
MAAIRSFLTILCSLVAATNAVTVYNQLPLGAQSTSTAAAATYTGNAATDPTKLNPPAPPNPLPPTQFPLVLMPTSDLVGGISIPAPASFFGFSIEMSVANQLLLWLDGDTKSVRDSAEPALCWHYPPTTYLNVPFLNFVSLIVERSGELVARVGGNTQDYAMMVDQTPNGGIIGKVGVDPNNPTATPTLVYTTELLYMMANISSLLNVKWFLGVPFNDTVHINLDIVEKGEEIIGQHLLGYQVSNEPDLYAKHFHRPLDYDPQAYHGEFAAWRDAWNNDPKIPVKDNLIGPSLSLVEWSMEQVWDTGFISDFNSSLYSLSVEKYPMDNCARFYADSGPLVIPQDVFGDYLSHKSGKNLIGPMLNSTLLAQQYQKPFIMFETNSASCGGFAGLSNSFGISLWALDYGLQMVYSNFTHALVHFGGQTVYYNPFTPPPTNETAFHEWTVGSIFYSILAMPEVLGRSNTARVVDLSSNDATPIYAIYENEKLARVALFNYMTESAGGVPYDVTISVGGGDTGIASGTPQSVKVKYLLADSVSEQFNITWGGQTFSSGPFQSDGRLLGDEQIQTVPCDTTAQTCTIHVPAPGFALVMISDDAASASEPTGTQTFATTAITRTANTAKVDASAVANSNGHSGKDRAGLGSTSKGSSGSSGGAKAAGVAPGATLLVVALSGAFLLMKALSS